MRSYHQPMGESRLWAVFIGASGDERLRTPLSPWSPRDRLPLRRIAEQGLRHDAAAVILARATDTQDCTVSAEEIGRIRDAKRTLDPIGLRLHDFIVWHGERSVSLRRAGIL